MLKTSTHSLQADNRYLRENSISQRSIVDDLIAQSKSSMNSSLAADVLREEKAQYQSKIDALKVDQKDLRDFVFQQAKECNAAIELVRQDGLLSSKQNDKAIVELQLSLTRIRDAADRKDQVVYLSVRFLALVS